MMKQSVFAHPTAEKLLASGIAEQSIFYKWSETNILFKIRPDWITNLNGVLFIVDLKSTEKTDDFDKSVSDYGYYLQDAFYSLIYERALKELPNFVFIVGGKHINCGRYPVRAVVLDSDDKSEGMARVLANIETLSECLETDQWGGFETITRPHWAKKNDITF